MTPAPTPSVSPVPTPSGSGSATPTPTPSPSAIVLRGVQTASIGAPSTSLNVAAVAGVQGGDLLMAAIFVNESGSANPSIAAPEGWTQVLAPIQNGAMGLGAVGIYTKVAGTAEPSSYTFTITYGAGDTGWSTECQLAAYGGANTAAPVDAVAQQQNGSSTTATAPSANVPAGHNSDQLVVTFAVGKPGTNPSTPTGMIRENLFDNPAHGVATVWFDQPLTASGATGTRVSQLALSTHTIGTTIAIAAASGSSPTPTPTSTPTPTATPTATATPTLTGTPTPSPIQTPTPTPTATATPTSIITPTATPTQTVTPAPTPSVSPVPTPSGSGSATPTPTPSPSAIVLRGVQTASIGAPSTSLNVAAVAGVQGGDLLMAAIFVNESGSANPSIAAPAGWTQVLAPIQNGAMGLGAVGVYTKVAGTAEPSSYTFTITYGVRVTRARHVYSA